MESKSDPTIIDNKVIEEMIATEKSYNTALTFLHLALHIEVEVNVKHNPLLREFKTAVANLKEISDALLQHAVKAVDMNISAEEHTEGRFQRTQLLKDFFKVYKDYAKLFDRYITESTSHQESFKTINYYVDRNSPGKLDLGALLIMPIQRGPRYSLLVREIRRRDEFLTETNKEEFKEVEALIAENLSSINSELRPPEGYWFDKITYSLLFGSHDQSRKTTPPPAIVASEASTRRYHFGDYTRSFVGTFFSAKPPVVEVIPVAVLSAREKSEIVAVASASSEKSATVDEVGTVLNEFVPLEEENDENPDTDTTPSSSITF